MDRGGKLGKVDSPRVLCEGDDAKPNSSPARRWPGLLFGFIRRREKGETAADGVSRHGRESGAHRLQRRMQTVTTNTMATPQAKAVCRREWEPEANRRVYKK